MPMNASALASLIASKVNAVEDSYKNGAKDPEDALTALAEAIIEHLQDNAIVKVTGGSSAGVYKLE